jgi:hypothetical protein
VTSRPLSEILVEEAAYAAAVREVVEAAKAWWWSLARRPHKEDRLIRSLATLERLEYAAAERIKAERGMTRLSAAFDQIAEDLKKAKA